MSLISRSALLLFTSIFSFALIGCDDSSSISQNREDKKIEIIIATSSEPAPFTTMDSNGNQTGYDIDVVKAIFKHLPQYEIKFETTEFSSVLAGLDSERYQVGANNFAMNEKRKEKYFYTDPIFSNQYVIVTPLNSEISKFEDLSGKKTEVTPGLNYATAMERYNQQNPDKKILINYTEADLLATFQRVESGLFDFQLVDKAMVLQFIRKHHLKLKITELNQDDVARIGAPYSYLLVSRGSKGEKLTQDINYGIAKIIEDGTLSQISNHYFGDDFSPKKQ